MGKVTDNHWQITGSEQRSEARRGQVLKQITLALVSSQSSGSGSHQRGGGCDPYDCRLGVTKRDVWGQQRRV